MPYKEHPAFEKPDNENIKIWRYMDFAKFVSLLERRCLFFASVDKLIEFDPFEGAYPDFNVKMSEVKMVGTFGMHDSVRLLHKYVFLNCWHINEYESDAMWRLYAQRDAGIAIQSTFKSLHDSFKEVDQEINIGKVKYIDYEKDWLPMDNIFYAFLHKRKGFDHERELRAVILDGKAIEEDARQSGGRVPKDGRKIDGHYIPVHVDQLVENVYVSPASPSWLLELIKSVATKYDLHKEITKSKLSEKPRH